MHQPLKALIRLFGWQVHQKSNYEIIRCQIILFSINLEQIITTIKRSKKHKDELHLVFTGKILVNITIKIQE